MAGSEGVSVGAAPGGALGDGAAASCASAGSASGASVGRRSADPLTGALDGAGEALAEATDGLHGPRRRGARAARRLGRVGRGLRRRAGRHARGRRHRRVGAQLGLLHRARLALVRRRVGEAEPREAHGLRLGVAQLERVALRLEGGVEAVALGGVRRVTLPQGGGRDGRRRAAAG